MTLTVLLLVQNGRTAMGCAGIESRSATSSQRFVISQLTGVSFEEDPDKVVSVAGKALCALAVNLDDLIDSEEMRLLPALRKVLFA